MYSVTIFSQVIPTTFKMRMMGTFLFLTLNDYHRDTCSKQWFCIIMAVGQHDIIFQSIFKYRRYYSNYIISWCSDTCL